MADLIKTLHPKDDLTTNIYPNVLNDNLPATISESKIPVLSEEKIPVLSEEKIPVLSNDKLPATISESKIPELGADKIPAINLSALPSGMLYLHALIITIDDSSDSGEIYFSVISDEESTFTEAELENYLSNISGFVSASGYIGNVAIVGMKIENGAMTVRTPGLEDPITSFTVLDQVKTIR